MRISKSSVFVIGALSIMGYVYAEPAKPATIQIKHTIDNATVRSMLKVRWKQCKQKKEIYQKTRDSNPSLWPTLEKRIRKRSSNYNLDAALAPVPKWDQIALEEESEYFNGDHYALYKNKMDYKLSTDGRCSIISTERSSAELDDGKFRYLINITKGTGVKYPSEVITFKKSSKQISTESAKLALKVMTEQGELTRLNAPKIIGSDVIASQKCDYHDFSTNGSSKLCYWHKMNHYPSIASRPIILKSIISIGKDTNIKQANMFIIGKHIDGKIFKPMAEINIVDRRR